MGVTGGETLEHVRRVMAGDRYAVEATGIELLSAGRDEVRCRLLVDDRHRNVRGVVMGGALFTMADYGAAVLANYDGIVADSHIAWVTVSSEIHFLTAADDGELQSQSIFVRRGRRMVVMQTDITDSRQRHVARIITTSTLVEP